MRPGREDFPSPYAFRASIFAIFFVIDITERTEVYFHRGQAGGFIGRSWNSWRPGKSKFLSFAIADVATAVTKGDLTRSVTVEAKGEVSELKDNVNEMIRNLRETTITNQEQDWLKTNVAKFTRMMQGQRDMLTVSRSLLSDLCPLVCGVSRCRAWITTKEFRYEAH